MEETHDLVKVLNSMTHFETPPMLRGVLAGLLSAPPEVAHAEREESGQGTTFSLVAVDDRCIYLARATSTDRSWQADNPYGPADEPVLSARVFPRSAVTAAWTTRLEVKFDQFEQGWISWADWSFTVDDVTLEVRVASNEGGRESLERAVALQNVLIGQLGATTGR